MTSPTEAKQVYSEDHLPEFTPMPWTLSEIRAAIPAHFHVRKTWKGLLYLARDLAMAAVVWRVALHIDPTFRSEAMLQYLTPHAAETARWDSSSLASGSLVMNNHASMERDEVYVPKTRSDLGIPKEGDVAFDYEDYLGDTPIYTLFMLVRQQVLAFPAYLLFNVSGQKGYPKWTNHFDPKSVLFTQRQRDAVILSNIGIAFMVWVVTEASRRWGASEVVKFYGIPWLLVTHWFIMITYLHHTDMELPHYRNSQWNFQRGAAATVDRNFLGWQGRFFLHDVAHFHVIHHFFPMLPFYNGAEATGYLKTFIGDHYRYSDKPVFQALWESYNDCQFVEDEGDVLFYRDRKGQARVRPATPFRAQTSDSPLAQQDTF
ncbi:hypothetical protein EVJ58_g2769 [Rhodofomes roseus]|uniref:Fatty acid desaturase domain-containing protein n=1 Tax=Rhodofomes roseus TaxID=34475 RepID=A0A4Y9YPA5_9APHY|nr:hypothetical protein EVJ58_g2769 [Rhodofomes roseus]